jgi:hypothetical protein
MPHGVVVLPHIFCKVSDSQDICNVVIILQIIFFNIIFIHFIWLVNKILLKKNKTVVF